MREPRGRHERRVGDDALGARSGLERVYLAHDLGFEEQRQLVVARGIDADAFKLGRNGSGQHEHVVVEAKL